MRELVRVGARERMVLVAGGVVFVAAAVTGYLAARGGSWVAGGVVVVAIAIAILLRARRTLLAATILALILGSVPNAPLKHGAFYLRFALLGAVAIVNLMSARRKYGDRRLRLLSLGLALVSAWAVLSILWSVDRFLTAERALAFFLLVAAVLTTALLSWGDAEAVRRDLAVVAGVLGAATTASLFALITGVAWAYLGGRFRGIFENPNTLGLSGGLLLPLAAGFALHGHRPRDRYAWTGLALVTGMLLLLTQSRNGLLGAVVAMVILTLGRRGAASTKVKAGLTAAALLVVLAFIAFPIEPPVVVDALQSYVQRGSAGRLSAWNLAWQLTRQRPLTGWGFGTTEEVFGPRAALLRAVFEGALVHNGYLQLLLEAGPVALALVLAVLGNAVWVGVGGRRGTLSWAVFAAFCGGALMQGAESGLTSAGSIFAFCFWLLSAATIRLAAVDGRAAVASTESVLAEDRGPGQAS